MTDRFNLPALGALIADEYRCERVLGQGGMGVVIAARHTTTNELVAIKLIRPDRTGEHSCVERFLLEGRIALSLKSEHVARVIRVGTLAAGEPYLVMEYLEGETLEASLRLRGALPVHVAVEYVLQACHAMMEAHALGIVHRDLKPANLFATRRRDRAVCIKVLDFGISKWTGSAVSAERAIPTTTTSPIGSPGYMSPEQLTLASAVDPRTDVWAMGVILFELVSGVHPFAAASPAGMCTRILRDTAPSLRAASAATPSGLDAIYRHCIAKDPARRMPSIASLAVALAPYASARARESVERMLAALPTATTTLDGPPAHPTMGRRRAPVVRVVLSSVLVGLGSVFAAVGVASTKPITIATPDSGSGESGETPPSAASARARAEAPAERGETASDAGAAPELLAPQPIRRSTLATRTKGDARPRALVALLVDASPLAEDLFSTRR